MIHQSFNFNTKNKSPEGDKSPLFSRNRVSTLRSTLIHWEVLYSLSVFVKESLTNSLLMVTV